MTLQKVKGFLEPDPNDGDGKIAEGKGSKSRTSFDIEIQKAASYDLTKISLFDEKRIGVSVKTNKKINFLVITFFKSNLTLMDKNGLLQLRSKLNEAS